MNRKQRRIAQSQQKSKPLIQFRGASYTVEEAGMLAMKAYNLKDFPAVIEIYTLIIAEAPQAETYNNLAIILSEMHRYDEALANYSKAIALKPGCFEAYNNRGMVLYRLKRYNEALANYDKAIAYKPDYADAYFNRSNVLLELQRYEESLTSNAKAIALNPNCAMFYYNRGLFLRFLKRHGEALPHFEKAATLDPNIALIIGDILHTKLHLCDWRGIDALLGQLSAGIEAGKPVSAPFIVIATPLSLPLQQKCARIYVNYKHPPAAARLWNGEPYAHDKIRIGYFSTDFHNHPVAYLMAEFFERHDRAKFEVMAFSLGPPSADAMRKRLEKAFDRFIDVNAKSDLEIATLVRDLEIDIAIDLNGLTGNSRTDVFALRPAPVQVNYMGYPGTMSASYIDYVIADPVIIPEEHQRYYTEKIACLPHTYQVNDSLRRVSEKVFTRREMDLPENGFIFCCFNNHYKITPDVFAIWTRLLHKVPGSVLWLSGGSPEAIHNLRAEAEDKGIAGQRLIFTRHMEDMADHLARIRLADVFLDTFHYNAHATASDALWVGLPLLTCLGETFAGRVAAGLLQAVGLPELIAHSHAEYEALALALATQPERLAAIKAKLTQNRLTCPLFDTALFTKHIEDAYRRMWERTQAGLPPAHIGIAG